MPELTREQIEQCLKGEPPKVPGGHLWDKDSEGRARTDFDGLPDSHSTALHCSACDEYWCIFCGCEEILEKCDMVIEGSLAPPALGG